MVSIPLGKSDYRRGVAHEPTIPLLNRYFEQNPTNLVDQVALLSRPALRRFIEVGQGPIRSLYSQPGSFEDTLFVVSFDELYRVDPDETVTFIANGIAGASLKSSPSMAATARLGSTPEYLYIADGKVLWVYTEDGFARGELTATGTIADTNEVRIGDIYYKWTSGSVDAGTPDGTSSNPWLVAVGVDNATSLDNLRVAVIAGLGQGTAYSTVLAANPDVVSTTSSATKLEVRAIVPGDTSNSLPTTVISGATVSWGAATLEHGGEPSFTQVVVPDDVGVVSVGYIAGFIIVVIAQGFGVNGRFYWINPGEITIDPLNFATAERSPDPVISVRVIGDQFWLLGTNSTEVWYPTGDPTGITPFSRVQGRLFDNGIFGGTDVAVRDKLILVDNDGVVYLIADGGPQRISDSSIEERMRDAIRQASTDII